MPKDIDPSINIPDWKIEKAVRSIIQKSMIEPHKIDHVKELVVDEGEFTINGCKVYIQGEEIKNVMSIKCDMDDYRTWYIDRHTNTVKTDSIYMERIKGSVRHER